MEAFWNQDAGEAGRIVSELLWRTISYNDCHEDYYHAFRAGTFVGIGYEVESNKEKGLGRPAVLVGILATDIVRFGRDNERK